MSHATRPTAVPCVRVRRIIGVACPQQQHSPPLDAARTCCCTDARLEPGSKPLPPLELARPVSTPALSSSGVHDGDLRRDVPPVAPKVAFATSPLPPPPLLGAATATPAGKGASPGTKSPYRSATATTPLTQLLGSPGKSNVRVRVCPCGGLASNPTKTCRNACGVSLPCCSGAAVPATT